MKHYAQIAKDAALAFERQVRENVGPFKSRKPIRYIVALGVGLKSTEQLAYRLRELQHRLELFSEEKYKNFLKAKIEINELPAVSCHIVQVEEDTMEAATDRYLEKTGSQLRSDMPLHMPAIPKPRLIYCHLHEVAGCSVCHS